MIPLRPLRRRLSHALARLGVLALLVNALFVGLHHPPALLAAFLGPETVCSDDPPAAEAIHHQDTDEEAPSHPARSCPFCTLVQGAKLVPPSPCLIFPPTGTPAALAPPDSDRPLSTILIAAHRPRGPPARG
jgi:hypothetical protein